jgi:DedD protein
VEQQLKERLVGAVVVVSAGVILIPLMLDGPPGNGDSRTLGLELPAPEAGTRTHTIRLAEPREQPPVSRPAPSAPVDRSPDRGSVSRAALPQAGTRAAPDTGSRAAPSAADPANVPSARPRTPAQSPAASPAPNPAPAEQGAWAVQVGSFSNQDNAARLQMQLVAAGYAAFVARLVTDGRTMHRVRVGPVDTRESAESLASKLAAAGHAGRVVGMQD